MEKKSYNLKNITLLQSSFSKEIDFDNDLEIKNKISIDVDYIVKAENVHVKLTVKMEGIGEFSKPSFSFDVTYLGEWEVGDVNELPLELFTKINAPAMIFPFVREHIASTSLKAGLDPIFLPTINFLKIIKEKNNIKT